MNDVRTLRSLMREVASRQERMLIVAQENDRRAEAAEAERLRLARALRLQAKVSVLRPTVTTKFASYRRIVEATERDPRVARAVIDALRYVEADIMEELDWMGR